MDPVLRNSRGLGLLACVQVGGGHERAPVVRSTLDVDVMGGGGPAAHAIFSPLVRPAWDYVPGRFMFLPGPNLCSG